MNWTPHEEDALYRLAQARQFWMLSDPEKPAGDGAKTDPLATDPPASRTFSQEEVTRMLTREKDQGEAAGLRKLEEQLQAEFGVDLDTAKKMLKASKDRQEAEKTEAQRAKEAADAEKAAAAKERQEAATERHSVKVERALLKAGADPEKIDRLGRLVDAEVGADEAAIVAAVEAVKTDFPTVFGASGGAGPTDGEAQGGRRPPKATPEGAEDRGRARAKARNPQPLAS